MYLAASGAAVLCVLLLAYARLLVHRRRRVLEARAISLRTLHAELEHHPDLPIVDVRQPLDLLAYPELLPGATRIAPKEILEGSTTVSVDRPVVFYCTCPGDETSRKVLQKALDRNIAHVRILRGGLAGWKAEGYPVQPYTESFHLDTATGSEEI